MKGMLVSLAAAVSMLVIAGCTQAAPPAPTPAAKADQPAKPAAVQPTAAPAKEAAQPTKAAAQPTAAPAKKVEFPEKGKAITTIVTYPAGGGADIATRVLAAEMETVLGAKLAIINEPGGATQVGTRMIAKAKPDGYTIGLANLPSIVTILMDKERQADFALKDLQALGLFTYDPAIIAVKGDSPFKGMKDLVDAAKANPGKVRVTDSGILSDGHIADLLLQEATGARFAIVHTEGGTQAYTEVLGGNADACNISLGANSVELVKSGQLRMLGIYDKQGDPRFPGVATAESQGYKVYSSTSRALSAPTGVPKEIVQLVAGSMKKIMDTADFKEKAAKMGLNLVYMNTAELETYWDGMEASVKPLISLAKK